MPEKQLTQDSSTKKQNYGYEARSIHSGRTAHQSWQLLRGSERYVPSFTSRVMYFQLHFLPSQQEYHPKIEIISEMPNDSDSAVEENNKSMFENSVEEEVPTAFFSNVCKIHKENEKEHLRPLVESFFTEPANSNRYLEIKDKQAIPSKPLIQEVITEPKDNLLLSPVCSRPDDPSSWEEDGKITVIIINHREKDEWHIHTKRKDLSSSCWKNFQSTVS